MFYGGLHEGHSKRGEPNPEPYLWLPPTPLSLSNVPCNHPQLLDGQPVQGQDSGETYKETGGGMGERSIKWFP